MSWARSAPLKRTPFKSKAHAVHQVERPPGTMPTVVPGLFRLPQPVGQAISPAPKREYVRSEALREAYRLIPCQNCGKEDGTVCCAHSNFSVHGKGGHIKADDSRGASLCAACHVPILDQGSKLTKAERRAMFWAAHIKTIPLLVSLGHWPAGVAVPDIETNPF